MKIYNPTDIGNRNKLSILRMIKEHDGISRHELSKRLHLSAPAVSNNVAALIENGIVYENGCDDTSLGRKPKQLSYKGNLYYVISVELMPGKVRGAIADLYGNIIFRAERIIEIQKGVQNVLDQLDSVIGKLLSEKPAHVEVIAIAVGVPALTGQDDLNDLFAAYLPKWKEIDLKAHILDEFGINASIVNDVELALIGEREKGEGKKQANIIYIKYGAGFAARAIVDGYLLKGHNMAAGELGYYLGSEDQLQEDFVCPGRFEKEICNDVLKTCENVHNLDELAAQVASGSAQAVEAVEKIVRKVAVVIANMVLMLNSERVILGGVTDIFTEDNLKEIKTVLSKVCPFVPEVVISKLGEEAPVIGGIKVALDYAEEQMVMRWKS